MKIYSAILVCCAGALVGLEAGRAAYGFAVVFGLLAIVFAMPDSEREK